MQVDGGSPVAMQVDGYVSMLDLWHAVTKEDWDGILADGYLKPDKDKTHKAGWKYAYLGLRVSREEALSRMHKINEKRGRDDVEKSQLVLLRISFAAAGVAHYAVQHQASLVLFQ